MKQCLLLGSLVGLVSGLNVSLPLEQGQVGDRMVIVDSTGARVKLACVNWLVLYTLRSANEARL